MAVHDTVAVARLASAVFGRIGPSSRVVSVPAQDLARVKVCLVSILEASPLAD